MDDVNGDNDAADIFSQIETVQNERGSETNAGLSEERMS